MAAETSVIPIGCTKGRSRRILSLPAAMLALVLALVAGMFAPKAAWAADYQLADVYNGTKWTQTPATGDTITVSGVAYTFQATGYEGESLAYVWITPKNMSGDTIWMAGSGYILLKWESGKGTLTLHDAAVYWIEEINNKDKPVTKIVVEGSNTVHQMDFNGSYKEAVEFTGSGSLYAWHIIDLYGGRVDLSGLISNGTLNTYVEEIGSASYSRTYSNSYTAYGYINFYYYTANHPARSLIVTEGSTLLIYPDRTLKVETKSNGKVENNGTIIIDNGGTLSLTTTDYSSQINLGTIINNGTVRAISGQMSVEQAKALANTETGTAELYRNSIYYSNGNYNAGNLMAVYQNGKCTKYVPNTKTLDFTGNSTGDDVTSATLAENGYEWDAENNTLKISSALYFPSGTIKLPADAKVEVTGDVTIGALQLSSGAPTISGDGSLTVNSALSISAGDTLAIKDGATASFTSIECNGAISVTGSGADGGGSALNATGDDGITLGESATVVVDDKGSITTQGGLTSSTADALNKIKDYLPVGSSIKTGDDGAYIIDANEEELKSVTLKSGTSVKLSEGSEVQGASAAYGAASSVVKAALEAANPSVTFVADDDSSTTVEGTLSFALPSDAATTDAGSSYKATWTFTPSEAGYKAITGSCEVTVAKATPTITWSKTTQSSSYTGSAVSITRSLTVTLADGKSYSAAKYGAYSYSYRLSTSTGDYTPGLPTNAGTYYVKATFAENGNYAEASSGDLTLTIGKAKAPTIAWPTAGEITYGQTLSQSSLTGGSTQYGEFTWTDGSQILEAGDKTASVTFTVNDATKANYNEITETTKTVDVKVNKADTSIKIKEDSITYTDDGCTVMFSATLTSVSGSNVKAPTGTVTFTAVAKDGTGETITVGTADITDDEATIEWASAANNTVYTVTATYNGDTNYSTATGSLEVNTALQVQTIAIKDPGTKTYGDAAFTLELSEPGSGNGEVTWTSSDESVVTISGSTATIKAIGEVTITATKVADEKYNQAEAELVLKVDERAVTVKADDKSVTVGGTVPAFTYTIGGSGLAEGDAMSTAEGEAPAFSCDADTGTAGSYVITISGGMIKRGTADVTSCYSFTYVNGMLTVSRPSSGGSSSNSVNVPETEGGSVDVLPRNGSEGSKVTVTVTPDDGYEFGTIKVVDKDGNAVKVTQESDGSFSFIMPRGGATVEVEFKEVPGYASCDHGDDCPISKFHDTNPAAWYHDGVHYVLDEGLMVGYSGTKLFGPDDATTRAMVAQVLYNKAGKPATSSASGFSDVAAGAWYAPAVAWAASEGVTTGYGDSGTFAPEDDVTREQFVVMLWRAAGKPEASDETLDAFKDADTASGWARDALAWATERGILRGYGDTGVLAPTASLTRAELATMLQRYAEL